MKLLFIKDAMYDGKLIAKAGDVKEISETNDFANRWIRRGIAVPEISVEVKEEQKPVQKSKNKATSKSGKDALVIETKEDDSNIEL